MRKLNSLNSTYQGHEHIYKDDVTDALLQVVYKLQKADKETDSIELQKIALHEAAHAVVGEILNPDSIGIVTIHGNQSCIGGFENGCSTYLKNEEELLNDITKTLAGKAGVSLIYGVMDVNASGDIQNANTISAKMRQLEYKDNIDYNKKAVNAYNSAFTSFKNNESRYKDKSQLFGLVSTTLFAYDAGRLFNETLIFYNHVYSYIFSKLDDNGKLELTRYSIECERKLR